MSFDQPRFTDAVKPQDAMAVVITLLGLAIALFLPDAIIKLIGGSIAVLGAIALYITLKQRVNDRIQLKRRRTTLPPPSFKTRVVTDPATSTTRIRFDDFQETFAGDDDMPEASAPAPRESSRPIAPQEPSRPSGNGSAAQPRPATISFGSADDLEDEEPFEGAGESFRILRPAGSDRPATTGAQQPAETATAVAQQTRAEGAERPAPALASEERSEAVRRKALLDLEALIASDGEDDLRANEPRAEFVRLVGMVLNAIARSISGHSIVFFWVNFDAGHMIPEASVTTGTRPIKGGARLRIGNDIVSQIARSGAPEIITEMVPASERELISYYDGAAGVRSFVGVPVFFRREVVGVLAADAVEPDAFDEVSMATLAEYTRLIAGLIRSYTDKYDLHLIARTLDAFETMSDELSGSTPTPGRIAERLVASVAALFDHRYVAAVLFDERRGEWRIGAVHSETVGSEIDQIVVDMRTSLVGRATRFAGEVLVEGTFDEPRFAEGEELPGFGTFLALPLTASAKCYGALAVEHPAPEAYIPRDIELMRDLASYAAMAIEVFYANRAIQSHTMVDEATGLFNADYFHSTLEREVARGRDLRQPLSVALVSIDLPQSLRAEESPEIEDVIANSVGSMLQSGVRPYDTVGRLDAATFGAILVARGDQESYLWAEKLRKEVASRILAIGPRKSAVTLSIGICDLGDLQGPDAMIDGARQALEKARGGEGNAVILY